LSGEAPINPIHVAVMITGEVLIVAGSGNDPNELNFQAAVWNPVSRTFQTQTVAWDMFCNGMVTLPDGRVFINGGSAQYDPFFGERKSAVFDPWAGAFSNVESMANGRWYPTVTTLGDGRIMTFSGLDDAGDTNSTVEIYTVGSGWSAPIVSGWTPPLYPRMHLSTDGRVFYAGSGRGSRFFHPLTNTWTPVIDNTNHLFDRIYGTSVLLPLTPANGYKPRVMILGGGNPATATTEIIDLSALIPRWQFGPSMSQRRIHMSATLLPNGKVLATGGSIIDEDVQTASLNADLYDPVTNTFSPAGSNVFARLYHSASVLLPDATVLLLGGNPERGSYERRLEIYSPAYLFDSNGDPAVRPAIGGVPPGPIAYGSQFQVQTPTPEDIASVVLVRPGAATHAFDMDQRLVGLSYTTGSGVLNVTAPPGGNIAPPGYYMLFVLNSAGVPSLARFVRIGGPDFILWRSPALRTVAPGESTTYTVTVTPAEGFTGTVSFSVTGLPSGTTATFDPTSVTTSGSTTMSVATTAATPRGAYPLTIRATSGTQTRTINVTLIVNGDFSISATPVTQTIARGGVATYTVTIAAGSGFNGTVNLAVIGAPLSSTRVFDPSSIVNAGTSVLTVDTFTSVLRQTRTLTIIATGGGRTHSANVTLTIQ
jgi:hypothetical protein